MTTEVLNGYEVVDEQLLHIEDGFTSAQYKVTEAPDDMLLAALKWNDANGEYDGLEHFALVALVYEQFGGIHAEPVAATAMTPSKERQMDLTIRLSANRMSIAQMVMQREIDRLAHRLHAGVKTFSIHQARATRARLDELTAINDQMLAEISRAHNTGTIADFVARGFIPPCNGDTTS